MLLGNTAEGTRGIKTPYSIYPFTVRKGRRYYSPKKESENTAPVYVLERETDMIKKPSICLSTWIALSLLIQKALITCWVTVKAHNSALIKPAQEMQMKSEEVGVPNITETENSHFIHFF